MALYRNGGFTADDWTFPAEGEALPETGKIALPKARFLAEREALLRRNEGVGVILDSGQKLDGLEADIDRLTLVVLRFPRYADGRLYSIARLLRDRFAYSGELRAGGDVLRDQITFMLRAGFDAFDVTHEGTIAALTEKRIVAVHHHYQPASAEAAEVRSGARPWQRRSSALGDLVS